MTDASPWMFWGGFPVAFGLTCVIEIPAYVAAFAALGWWRRGSPSSPLSLRRAVATATLVNVLSHPLLWAVVLGWATVPILTVAELGVVLVEGLVIFAVVRRSARLRDSVSGALAWSLGTAFGVNALSVLIGLLVLPLVLSAGSSASG